MEVLKIEWYQTFDNNSKGYMELKVDKFFPSTAKTATKVFHLVRRWCSDEQISELEQFFLQKVEESDKRKTLQVKWCRMLKLFYSAVSDILPTKKMKGSDE